MTFRSWRSYIVKPSRADLTWLSYTIQGKRTITRSIEVRIEKFKSLTSISLMWIQFTKRTHYQIPFISYPKTSSNVQLMHMIKNREIFLVQIAIRLFSKHIYRSLRALLNSTLTRNEFGSFQTQTIHKIKGSKPCIYTFYTKTRQIPYCSILKSIHVIFFFPSFFLLFSSSSSSSSSSLLLCSLLSVFALSFFKTRMRYLFWSYPYLILSIFYFTFSLFWSILDHPVKVRKFPPSFLQATCLFHNFLPYFILISFFYYSLVLQLSITLNLTYAYSYFGIDFTINFCINSEFLLILFLSLF